MAAADSGHEAADSKAARSSNSLHRRQLQTAQRDTSKSVARPVIPPGYSTGYSYYNPADFPLPPGYRAVIKSVHRIMGRNAILAPIEVQQAFQFAFEEIFDPLRIQVRWLNYTIHPEYNKSAVVQWYNQDEFRPVDYQALVYEPVLPVGQLSNLSMGTVFNNASYLAQIVSLRYGHSGVSLTVLSEEPLTQTFFQNQPQYGAARSVIELTGSGLRPFTEEKANAMLVCIMEMYVSTLTSRAFFINITSNSTVQYSVSDGPAPAPRSRRTLRQEEDSVRAVVWLGLQPLEGTNMTDLWKGAFYEVNDQQVYVVSSNDSFHAASSFRDFPSYARYLTTLTLTGRFISSQLYAMNDPAKGFVISDIKPGPARPPRAAINLIAGSTNAPVGPGVPATPQPVTPTTTPGPTVPAPEPDSRIAFPFPVRRSKHKLGPAVIILIAVGVFAFFFLLVVAGLCIRWRSRKRAKRAGAVSLDKPTASSSSRAGSTSSSGMDAASNGHGAPVKWKWSDPNSGVVEPVWASVMVPRWEGPDNSHTSPLHRACELFADERSPASTAAQVAEERAHGLPPLGGYRSHVASSEPLHLRSSDGSTLVSGSCDSLPSALTSAPFVAGEIDPAEIEICLDADGNQVVLGEGAFGTVYKGLRRGVHEVAIKRLGNLSDPQLIRQFRKEIAILGRVSFQPNIVNFYGACLKDPTNIMLIMENMAGGDLRQALSRSETDEFRWYQKGRTLALDIAKGLHFLHSSKVTHRDLKTSNILLSQDGHTAKIGDVGLSRSTLTDLQSSLDTVGTFCYAAPEMLMGEKCSEAIDLFSYGVCLWEVVTGDLPVRGYLRDVEVPAECPAEVRQLISDCMESDPKRRPTARELVRRMIATPKKRMQAASGDDLQEHQSHEHPPRAAVVHGNGLQSEEGQQ